MNNINKGKHIANGISSPKRFLRKITIPIFLALFSAFFISSKAESSLSHENFSLTVNQPPKFVKVSGIITDESGEPLPGVSIIVEGTSHGTTTNITGGFEIDV